MKGDKVVTKMVVYISTYMFYVVFCKANKLLGTVVVQLLCHMELFGNSISSFTYVITLLKTLN